MCQARAPRPGPHGASATTAHPAWPDFHQREVARVALLRSSTSHGGAPTSRFFQVSGRRACHTAEKLRTSKYTSAIDGVGVAVGDELFDEPDHLRHVVGRLRLHPRAAARPSAGGRPSRKAAM